MTSLTEIRAKFLDYFAREGHEVVASSPLVPRNDPTLMFTNAGMVQFKNVFTGQEKRGTPRAATSQKCVRAGGKHNDLDNVGYTARHHTFFEMLGNFSFGDYFKDRAIELAWNLVTREYGLPKDKLLVTVYSEDEEAAVLWKKIAGLGDDKIIRIPTSDNFWQMGDTGPCGPCSEIFFDHGPHIQGGPPGSPDQDGDRFIEVWNLVFMQFEQLAPGNRVPLPKPSIDTGMGLERIGAVLQGKHDNYDTDLMRALIVASADLTGVAPDGGQAVSHRVIADHLRASSFLVADGVLPSNEGRGYVLRRIMRRAMRHAHLLGAKEPLMWRLVPALVREMGQSYPELVRAQSLIQETLSLEENRFRVTLERGLKLLDEATGTMASGAVLEGETAFKLYDTYGFPLDLTQDALRPRGIGVDTDGFAAAMARQKAEARKAWAGSGEKATETLWFELREELGATEFLGYDTEVAEGSILALVQDGSRVKEAQPGAQVLVLLNQTPFYAESGGQVGDSGILFTAQGARIEITDTLKKLGDLHVHIGTVADKPVKQGDVVEARVDGMRRTKIRANHSATHLMHESLRRVLGDHVMQKGSMVGPDRLRFDFAHQKPMTDAEIAEVETLTNACIRRNADVSTRLMSPDEAIKEGAMALFGEKYGDEVRVLAMGGQEENGRAFSVELCGGTHVTRTGDIALFAIISEAAVASGVRRIEALTGEAARLHFAAREKALKDAADALRAPPEEVASRVVSLMAEKKRLEKELAETRKKLAMGGSGGGETAPEVINGVPVVARVLDGVPGKDVKGLVESARKKLGSGIVAFVAVAEGKASLVVSVSEDQTGRVSAIDLVRAGAEAVGGKGGGGRPDMAQAGGPDGAKAEEAIAAIKHRIAGLAGAA